jgi:hypothetical protein
LRLTQAGLPQESVGRRFIAEIAERGKIGPKLVPPDEQTWLELLQKARPVEFSYVYLLIDVTDDEVAQNDVVVLSQQLQPLIRLIITLNSVGVYVKLFIPKIFRQHLIIPPDITVDKLIWPPEKLTELLQARLNKAGNYQDLSQLFDAQSRSPSPTDRLINAASGSPQQLIRLGNQLLKAHIRQNPGVLEISHQDLELTFKSTNTT